MLESLVPVYYSDAGKIVICMIDIMLYRWGSSKLKKV